MNTLDRYLFKRFLHTFAILFVSTFGLFVVIDGFTNVDGFQEGRDSSWEVFMFMFAYYTFQSSLFFNLIGTVISVVAVMVVFALLQKNSEFHPVLAAGIPTYRLFKPMLLGLALVSGLMMINQELIIPKIASQLNSPRSVHVSKGTPVEPLYDRQSRIHIGGKGLDTARKILLEPEFLLPLPEISNNFVVLKANQGMFFARSTKGKSGWLLKGIKRAYEDLDLTPRGKEFVLPTKNPQEIFVVSDVTFSELSRRSQDHRFLSTEQLAERIRNPSTGFISVRRMEIQFHWRIVRYLLNLISVFIVVPIILRKESRSLVMNMALCATFMGSLYGFSQLMLFAGKANFVSPDLASWSSVIVCGTIGAWFTGMVQT